MTMQMMNLEQGSEAWHTHRRNHFNASDAPAMMACSPYKTRTELIKELATGITAEVDASTQRRFDDGHTFEKLALPLAEKIAGESLSQCVGTLGKYSASFDGLTYMSDTAFEHKSLNAALREAMTEGCTGADLPMVYQVQMEQQAMVSGCERILFMASKWEAQRETGEWQLVEERHCWYAPNMELRARIVAGWEQLDKDIAAYAPPIQAQAPKQPLAKVRRAIPALVFEATGEITASNVDEFQAEVLERVNSVNMVLKTDADFVDADSDAKWLRDISKGMKIAVQRVRGGMSSVNEVLNILEQLDTIAAQKANDLEKRVTSEKNVRKAQIAHAAQAELDRHIHGLNQRLRANWLPRTVGGFDEAIKGKRSPSSMEDAVAVVLTNAKHDANVLAQRFETNRAHLVQEDGDWIALFADFAAVGAKAAEDFEALAALRIGNHKQAEAKRLEGEREKIRAQEQTRAEATVRAEQEQKRQAEEAEAAAARAKALRVEQEAQAAIADAHNKAEALPAPLLNDLGAVATHIRDEAIATIDTNQVISAAKSSAPAADTEEIATMTLGQINTLIAPLKVDAAGLADLGFTPSATVKAAKHFPASDVPKILAAMVRHLQGLMVAA